METILLIMIAIFMVILIAILGVILSFVLRAYSTLNRLRCNPIFTIPSAVVSIIDDYKRKKVGKKW